MTADEVDAFLTGERTCRVATVDGQGQPHVTPLWFAWDGAALWLNSLVRSQRWTDLVRNPHVAVVVDAGTSYGELRGVEMRGAAHVVGEVPRSRPSDERVAVPEQLFGRKYNNGGAFPVDGRHAWLRVVPDIVISWDHRKLGRLSDRR